MEDGTERCGGVIHYDPSSTQNLAISLFPDDNITVPKDGFDNLEPIIWKISIGDYEYHGDAYNGSFEVIELLFSGDTQVLDAAAFAFEGTPGNEKFITGTIVKQATGTKLTNVKVEFISASN
jgi:hypothetical protein